MLFNNNIYYDLRAIIPLSVNDMMLLRAKELIRHFKFLTTVFCLSQKLYRFEADIMLTLPCNSAIVENR